MAFGMPVSQSLFEQLICDNNSHHPLTDNPFVVSAGRVTTLPPPPGIEMRARVPFPTASLPSLDDPLATPPRLEREQAIGIDDDDDDDDDDDTAPGPRQQATDDYSGREFREEKGHWVKLLNEICEHYVVGDDDTTHERYILTDAAAINTITDHIQKAMADTVYFRQGMTIVNTLTAYASPSYRGSSGLRYATLKHIISLIEYTI
mgnify:CR=1 FL=1